MNIKQLSISKVRETKQKQDYTWNPHFKWSWNKLHLEKKKAIIEASTSNSCPSMMLVRQLMIKIGDETCHLHVHAWSWLFISSDLVVYMLGKYDEWTLDNIEFLVATFKKTRQFLATSMNFEENDQLLEPNCKVEEHSSLVIP
jgi:hypothetical protein